MWALIVTVAVYGSIGTAQINTSRIGTFNSRQECDLAGKDFVNANTSYSVRSSYVCIRER